MILTILSTLLISFSIWTSWKEFQKDSSLIKFVYTKRPIDWLWSLLIVLFVAILIILALSMNLPNFMTWSWLSLLSDTSTPTATNSGNLITAPLRSNSILLISGFWIVLSLCLPYLAKGEEELFRSHVFSLKNRIKTNIKFGLVHMLVGVPLFAALILSLVGFLYSVFYIRSFNEACKQNPITANHIATNVSTSVHAKYNFIIITITSLVTLLAALVN